jgi:hypothetical protein
MPHAVPEWVPRSGVFDVQDTDRRVHALRSMQPLAAGCMANTGMLPSPFLLAMLLRVMTEFSAPVETIRRIGGRGRRCN